MRPPLEVNHVECRPGLQGWSLYPSLPRSQARWDLEQQEPAYFILSHCLALPSHTTRPAYLTVSTRPAPGDGLIDL